MQPKEKILFCWSSGKDCALALERVQRCGQYEVAALLSTITADYDRVSMHGVRRELLEQQAEALGYPLEKVLISKDADNDQYERRMLDLLLRYGRDGLRTVAFGDVFLDGIREYRESNLAKAGMRALFPIWQQSTAQLAQSFIDSGYRAIITCVDSQLLDGSFVGREFDQEFLDSLPPDVDPCGENGEFHSFVYAGPIFSSPIPFKLGQTVVRDERFHFTDLLPA